jgi:hypothetical protein
MISRILNPKELRAVLDDLDNLFSPKEELIGHQILTHDKESIINSFGNTNLLAWDVFVWANKQGETYDGVIVFINDKNIKFNKCIFSEFLWLSKNPKSGFKLLKTAVAFAREKGFEYITTSCTEKNPQSKKLARVYKNLGFLKDSEIYIAKL